MTNNEIIYSEVNAKYHTPEPVSYTHLRAHET